MNNVEVNCYNYIISDVYCTAGQTTKKLVDI